MALNLKERISSPLEAGTSIVDGHHLPPNLTPALEYTSKRLARKALHLTCVVVRRDYQLPSPTLSSPGASGFSSPASPELVTSFSASSTPVWPAFTTSPIGAIKNIVRSNLPHSDDEPQYARGQSLDLQRNGTVSPTFSDASLHSGVTTSTASTASSADTTFTSTQARWGPNPMQSPSIPMTPATPFTVASSATGTTDTGSAVSGVFPNVSHQFGMKLLHATPLTAREDKGLRHSLERAARKFNIGPEWISNPITPSFCGLTGDLIDRSLLQNELLFASEGLTLLALDHLYTFKCALQSYTRTQSPCRLEDAVDELRRLVLGNDMRKLRKSLLVHTYGWLGQVDDTALKDVCQMYHKAYGSHDADNGVDDDMNLPNWPLPETRISLHGEPLIMEQDANVLSDEPLRRFSLEDLLGKPLPKTPVGMLSPVEPEEEERGRAQRRSATPRPRSPLHSNASRNSGTPSRRKSPPAALHIASPPLYSHPPSRSGLDTPRSTVTEQSESARSTVSILTTQSERAATPQLDRWGEEKETLGIEVELDMDEIEDWYREVDIDLDTITFKPAREVLYRDDPPSQVESTHLVIAKPVPLPPPQPPSSAKAGLFGLRLDTTFKKPQRRVVNKGHHATQSMDAAIGAVPLSPGGGLSHDPGPDSLSFSLEGLDLAADVGDAGEDTEEELTARPPDSAHPATEGLRGFKRWNSVSIDSVLSPVEGPSGSDDRVGPMTPNGYDDISPITRGEWGFLMVGGEWKNGRQVNVTKCL